MAVVFIIEKGCTMPAFLA